MISRELVEKINRLWHKQKTVGLTAEEKEEQRLARAEYLAGIRTQVKGMLEELRSAPQDVPHANNRSNNSNSHNHGCSCKDCQ